VDFARVPTAGSSSHRVLLWRSHRALIIKLAIAHKLPAVFVERHFVIYGGGLISYGPDFIDQFRGRRVRGSDPEGSKAGGPGGPGADKYES